MRYKAYKVLALFSRHLDLPLARTKNRFSLPPKRERSGQEKSHGWSKKLGESPRLAIPLFVCARHEHPLQLACGCCAGISVEYGTEISSSACMPEPHKRSDLHFGSSWIKEIRKMPLECFNGVTRMIVRRTPLGGRGY